MNKAFFGIFLAAHRLWLEGSERGIRIDLQDADLRGADLQDADLRGADLQDADLRGADLQDADLRVANLRGANLQDADLRVAYLRGADLRGADLQRAALQGANLQGANLQGADRIIGPQRSDGYLFTYCIADDIVIAGCRKLPFDEFEAHISRNYEGTDKAAETRAILRCLRILVESRRSMETKP